MQKENYWTRQNVNSSCCVANCAFNANSIQVVCKIFYLRESICDTYKAYVAEQKQYGLWVLFESAMYKNLPKFVPSQKYIPFIECLCVKCLNFSLLVDTLRVAGITVRRRAILNVIASICPFLVDKDAVNKIPEVLPQENTEKKNAKSTMPSLGVYHNVLDLPLPTIGQVSVMVWT